MKPFIGVDLDGTLAFHKEWTIPTGVDDIGEPIPAMVERVKLWLEEGKTVKIFTARAHNPAAEGPIKAWCLKHIGTELEVTNIKTPDMIEIWDDRAVSIVRNTGIAPSSHRPLWDWID